MEDYAEIFKALSDKIRLRIMHLLCASNTELCVCELVDALEEYQYNISRHLKVLKHAGLIEERQEGRWIYYKLASQDDPFKKAIIDNISKMSDPQGLLAKDMDEIQKRFQLREGGKCLRGIQKTHLEPRRQSLINEATPKK